MPNTTKITLARGLKLKNRLVSRLSNLWTEIATYNSTIEGAEKYEVKPIFERYKQGQQYLIGLKIALNAGTQAAWKFLAEMEELRGLVKNLNSISTLNGPQHSPSYRMARVQDEKPLIYQAQFTKQDINKMVKEYEARIDALQEELDKHNHTQTIDIDSGLLTFVGPE